MYVLSLVILHILIPTFANLNFVVRLAPGEDVEVAETRDRLQRSRIDELG